MDDEQFAVTTALIALTRALLVAKAGDRDLLRKHLTSGRKGPAGLRPRPGPHRSAPRLLSDNGLSYVAAELADWLDGQGMGHTRGQPYHPMTQGKIERWHLSLKSRILLDNYYLPGDLERAIAAFIDHYNHHRYHESLDNLTPADVYFGRGQRILDRRRQIKLSTIDHRRRLHFAAAA